MSMQHSKSLGRSSSVPLSLLQVRCCNPNLQTVDDRSKAVRGIRARTLPACSVELQNGHDQHTTARGAKRVSPLLRSHFKL